MIRLLRALLKTLDPPAGASHPEQQASCSSGGGCGCRPAEFPPSPLVASGWEKLNEQRYREAMADFDQAISEDQNDPTPFYGRGLAKAGFGDHADAILDFNEAYRRNTTQSQVLSSRGHSHWTMGNFEAALADFTRAVRLDPNDAYSSVSRAGCLLELGSLDQADEGLEEALDLIDFRDDASLEEGFRDGSPLPVIDEVDVTELTQWRGDCRGYALCVRGQLRTRQGRFEEALADLRHACELDPQDSWRASALAWLLATCPDARFRDGSEALSLAERAASSNADSGSLSTLAASLAEVGRLHDAIQTVRKAVQLAALHHRADLNEELETYESGAPYRDPLMPFA